MRQCRLSLINLPVDKAVKNTDRQALRSTAVIFPKGL